MGARVTRGGKKDEITYFFLVKHTDQGSVQTPAFKKRGINDVTSAVQKEGGQCRLYATRGGAFDYVSMISGVTPAGAIRIATQIESRGTVKATLLTGMELFHQP